MRISRRRFEQLVADALRGIPQDLRGALDGNIGRGVVDLHAEDIGVGIARAIRAAVSGRPGGVYLDLPGKLFAQSIDAETARRTLIQVVDPAPRQIPAPDSVKRALELLRGAKKPLIILGKGAAYAQAYVPVGVSRAKTFVNAQHFHGPRAVVIWSGRRRVHDGWDVATQAEHGAVDSRRISTGVRCRRCAGCE